MFYTEETLTKIEELASIYMPISDIALVLELDETELKSSILDPSNDAGRAYRKGKALSKVFLHQQEMKLAKVGSPTAIENVHRNLLEMQDDEQ